MLSIDISAFFAMIGAFLVFLAPSLITVASVLVVLMRFDIRKVLGYATLFDIVFTIGLMVAFAGTFTGMMTN